MLRDSAPLFTYMSEARAREHLTNKGLRVSAGAERLQQYQEGEFPRGAYGTDIPPYADNISQNAMKREFFDIEYSLPSVDATRDALPTTHFVAFLPSTGFSPKGSLNFSRLQVGFNEEFQHYALASPDLNPGDYMPYDIIAIGRNLIPEEITGSREAVVARDSSDPETSPVRNPDTMEPQQPGPWTNVNRLTRRRSNET